MKRLFIVLSLFGSMTLSGCASLNFPRAEFLTNIPLSTFRVTLTNTTHCLVLVKAPGWSLQSGPKGTLHPGEEMTLSFWNGSGDWIYRSISVYKTDLSGNILGVAKWGVDIPPGRYPGDWPQWVITEDTFQQDYYITTPGNIGGYWY